MSFGDDFHSREEPFMIAYPWAVPLIFFGIFFIIAGIGFYCTYRHRRHLIPWLRRPAVVVIQSAPDGSSTTHVVRNYPGGTSCAYNPTTTTIVTPQYPVSNNYPATTTIVTPQYPVSNNYPTAPPAYTDVNDPNVIKK